MFFVSLPVTSATLRSGVGATVHHFIIFLHFFIISISAETQGSLWTLKAWKCQQCENSVKEHWTYETVMCGLLLFCHCYKQIWSIPDDMIVRCCLFIINDAVHMLTHLKGSFNREAEPAACTPERIIIPNPFERSFSSPSNVPGNTLIRQRKCWCRSLCAVSVPSFYFIFFFTFFVISTVSVHARCIIIPSDTRAHPQWDVWNRDPSLPQLFASGGVTFCRQVFALESPPCFFVFTKWVQLSPCGVRTSTHQK